MLTWGNYFAVPSADKFTVLEYDIDPGEVIFGDGNISLNSRRKAVILKVINTGDRPVQVFALACLFSLCMNFLSLLLYSFFFCRCSNEHHIFCFVQ